jgi:molecular chaperone GrpE
MFVPENEPQPEESMPTEEVLNEDAAVPETVTLEAAEFQKIMQEREQLRDQLMRALADFQNFRKRALHERAELEKFATANLVRDLLPVLDNFERTLLAIEQGATLESLSEGVTAVEKQLRSVLENRQVKRIESVGMPFDPELHEALGTDFTTEWDPDTVTTEIEPGYMMADRVIRPARVKVAFEP